MKKLLIGLLLSTSAYAIDSDDYIDPNKFRVMGPLQYEGTYVIIIDGNFDKDSYEKIKIALNSTQNKPTIIYAESFGGYANDIVKTADAIHNHGNVTWIVKEGSFCMSACAMVALGAKKIDGILHFHAITYTDTNQVNIQMTNQVVSMLKSYKKDINLVKATNSKRMSYIKF